MQIGLTDADNGFLLSIADNLILTCRRDPKSKLTTLVLVGIQGPGGFQMLNVKESPEEVARRVNYAFKCEVPMDLLGFPQN